MNVKNMPLRPPIGSGILTILMVLVILLLSCFASMSLLSANADKNLTDEALYAITSYYDADTKAEKLVHDIGAIVTKRANWREELSALGVFVDVGDSKAVFAFSVPYGDGGRLWVELEQKLRNGRPEGFPARTLWQARSEEKTNE